MPRTLNIDDDALATAERLAAQRHQTVDQVVSSLIRQAATHEDFAFETRNGVPLIPHTSASRRVTFEMVKKLQDELPD